MARHTSRFVALLCVLSLLFSTQSQAQFFSTGIQGGLTSSNLFSNNNNQIPTMGLSAGLAANFKFANWLQLRTEANLLWHGTDRQFWEAGDVDYYKANLPAMLLFSPVRNCYIGGGAALEYLMHVDGAAMPTDRLSMGLLGHVEYRFFDRLGLGIRYTHYLSSGERFNDLRDVNNPRATSAAFPTGTVQATLSYRFGR